MPAAPRPVRVIGHAARVVTVAAVLVTVTLAGMTHTAPLGGWVADTTADRDAAYRRGPVNVPSWTTATPAERTGCVPVNARPATIPASLLVSDRDGVVTRLPYTDTTVTAVRESGTGPRAVYVIGACTTL